MTALRRARLTDMLKPLLLMGEMVPHKALIRHLQFSPNGRYLATSSTDMTSVILRVGEALTTHRILEHVQGFIGQVAWSPNGRILLTDHTRAVKVWSKEGVCEETIERQNPVTSIIWPPTGEGKKMSPEDSLDENLR
ncbi:hypothetical protein HYDPIDRAFT_118829 [Hydnomerulius pinastri MD-312]|uniref:Anaphase-promoting complex subunit 4 WD40 domain-containing protein n=1 Tax=Hydnomerulius pinastri MD-312 TaxID=994086 RepID=A0A0C9W801_9AGAM|nr:hypothetical protein HYDPIDRAFT_118829 [Hydnomerulius pinastri MD-312]